VSAPCYAKRRFGLSVEDLEMAAHPRPVEIPRDPATVAAVGSAGRARFDSVVAVVLLYFRAVGSPI